MPCLIEIDPVVLEKKDENVKSLRQQQQKTNLDQKSSFKPSANVS